MASIFVSHRGLDQEPAERLATELRLARHDVWLDTWTVRPGDSIVHEITSGLTRSAYLVLCLSRHGPSPWLDREWMSALARQLDAKDIVLLPVRLTGGDLPAILADIKLVDLVADWPNGVKELLRALR